MSTSFDAYWASGSAYPADRILGADKQKSDLQRDADQASHAAEAQQYIQAVETSDYARALLARQLRYECAPVRMEADDPAKGLARAAPDELLWPKLETALGEPRGRLQLVSAYFAPTQVGVDACTRMARQGANVTVLTNSFEATDVPVVHSGYAKWRNGLPAGAILSLRTGLAVKPAEYDGLQVAGGGFSAGIRFTTSLFIAGEAFWSVRTSTQRK